MGRKQPFPYDSYRPRADIRDTWRQETHKPAIDPVCDSGTMVSKQKKRHPVQDVTECQGAQE